MLALSRLSRWFILLLFFRHIRGEYLLVEEQIGASFHLGAGSDDIIEAVEHVLKLEMSATAIEVRQLGFRELRTPLHLRFSCSFLNYKFSISLPYNINLV